jgi:esterase/lipase superfamily enzyme
MHREAHEWHSPALGRSMRLLWYGREGRPILIFPTSMGHESQNEDFGLIGGVGDLIERGVIQACCVNAVDEESWYNRGAHPADRVRRHDAYDRYLASEVVPFIHSRMGRRDLIAYGASFGGFHAANFARSAPGVGVARRRILRRLRRPPLPGRLLGRACYFHCLSAYVANFPPGVTERTPSRWESSSPPASRTHLAPRPDRFRRSCAQLRAVHEEIWPGVFGPRLALLIDNLRRFVP